MFEREPRITRGLTNFRNVILTPHIASATTEARERVVELAAKNIIAVLSGNTPPNLVR